MLTTRTTPEANVAGNQSSPATFLRPDVFSDLSLRVSRPSMNKMTLPLALVVMAFAD